MSRLGEAMSGWANTHKESLITAKAAILSGNPSLAVEILDMTLKIMDEMLEGLKKI